MQGSLYTTVAEAVSPVLVSWQVLCCQCFHGASKGEGSPAVASSTGLYLRGLFLFYVQALLTSSNSLSMATPPVPECQLKNAL